MLLASVGRPRVVENSEGLEVCRLWVYILLYLALRAWGPRDIRFRCCAVRVEGLKVMGHG